jgi:hypothetical protein
MRFSHEHGSKRDSGASLTQSFGHFCKAAESELDLCLKAIDLGSLINHITILVRIRTSTLLCLPKPLGILTVTPLISIAP